MTEQKQKRKQQRRLYRMNDVIQMYDLSKPTIYRMIKSGLFPKPVKVGERAVRWKGSTLAVWEDGLREAE